MTTQENLTNIKLTDLSEEAQEAATYDIQEAKIEWANRSEQYLSVSIKQKRNDEQFALQFDPIEVCKKGFVEDAISLIEDAIIDAYYKKYKGEDPANLRHKYKDGLFCRKEKEPPYPRIPSMESDKYGLISNQFVEDGEIWTPDDPDADPENFK